MARFYSQERGKYGTLSGTIIIWPVQYNVDPISAENKAILPAGYLKCDGSKYNAVSYPQLAEILGVGTATKFLKRNLSGDPVFQVKDTEFVVPDLGSKFPRPVPGPDAGSYNNVLEENGVGIEVKKSGIGITAESVVGNTVRLSYAGKFSLPSQTIPIVGKPVWTSGSNNSKRTDQSEVESSGIYSHMHFSTTKRTRIKSANTVSSNIEPSTGICYYKVGTTVNIQNWLVATTHPDASSYPGSNQPACWVIASNDSARAATGNTNPTTTTLLGITTLYEKYTYNVCWNDGDNIFTDLKYNCLLTAPATYQIGQSGYFGSAGAQRRKWLPSVPLIGCTNFGELGRVGNGSTPSTYTTGTAPTDWKDISLVDVVPLNSNSNSSQTRGYSQVENSMTEVSSPASLYTGDPTVHNHGIVLERGEQAYNLITESVLIEPDALNTQLTLSTSNAVSLDAVSSPFIIMEYLIKI
jgi:hypothetical protein